MNLTQYDILDSLAKSHQRRPRLHCRYANRVLSAPAPGERLRSLRIIALDPCRKPTHAAAGTNSPSRHAGCDLTALDDPNLTRYDTSCVPEDALGQNWDGQLLGSISLGVTFGCDATPAYVVAALAFTNHSFSTNRTALGDDITSQARAMAAGSKPAIATPCRSATLSWVSPLCGNSDTVVSHPDLKRDRSDWRLARTYLQFHDRERHAERTRPALRRSDCVEWNAAHPAGAVCLDA